jgi:YVTN family beta-propeller protein
MLGAAERSRAGVTRTRVGSRPLCGPGVWWHPVAMRAPDADDIDFRILGPLEAIAAGRVVPLGGARQRAFLAVLLLHAGQVVWRDRLIEDIWGDDAPPSAAHSLEVYASALRKGLLSASGGGLPAARAGGYVLQIEPKRIDAVRFEALVADGRDRLAAGDAAAASERLGTALAMWRGPALGEFAYEAFAQAETARLEELRLGAVEDRIDADLLLGRHAEVVGELRGLLSAHPLRERLIGEAMLALYRTGRQAEALEVYGAARRRLAEELGIDPSPELRALETAVLRQSDELAVHPAEPAGVQAAPDQPLAATPVVSESGDPWEVLEPIARRPPSTHRDLWRSRRLLISAGVAAALLAAGLPLALRDGGAHLPSLDANTTGEIDPSSNAILASVRVGPRPSGIAYGARSLWVANMFGNTVSRIDPNSHRVMQTISVGHAPVGLAFAAGAVWVANSEDRTVSRISPAVNRVVDEIPVGNGPTAVAVGHDAVWVVNTLEDTVSRIDPSNDRAAGPFSVGGRPTAIAVTDSAVWVANASDGTVSQLDPGSGSVVHLIDDIGNGPAGIAVGAGSVWVTNSLDGTVSRIDPTTSTVAATIPVGDGPRGIGVGAGTVWVANEFGESVSRIDAAGNSVTDTIPLGSAPLAISLDGGSPWVTTRATSDVHRGGTLRWFPVQWLGFDPATSYAQPDWAALSMTNDGLVTVERVGGLDGATIVPDLAVSVPEPTDGGRTYTFHMRPGIKYSTGEPVRPSDIRHGIERLFEVPGGGAVRGTPYYRDILGVQTCLSHPDSPCDLSFGIEVNDSAGTIAFHLTRPDPEFLYELTLPFADAVPAGVPSRDQTTSPIPATGPYMVQDSTHKELVLVRNPEFHEWSAAAQPDGYPDRIEVLFKVDAEHAVTRIMNGSGDVMTSVPADRLDEIGTRYPAQLYRYASTDIFTIAFDTRVPPFDDVRVRRAVNFALDRRRIVQMSGGPGVASATCQILPPQFPGYEPYCPYTKDPRESGRWTAPDVQRARALIAASGTGGQTVTMYAHGTGRGADATTLTNRYVASLLRDLGYRVKVKWIEDGIKYFGTISDSRREPQVFAFGWIADYPGPSNFFNVLLSCASFQRGTPANLNYAEFCSPAVDRKIQRALRLQSTDAAAAGRAWADVDRTVTDLAPWAPMINDLGADFVSARVGNYQYNPEFGLLPDQMWVR